MKSSTVTESISGKKEFSSSIYLINNIASYNKTKLIIHVILIFFIIILCSHHYVRVIQDKPFDKNIL